MPTYRSAFISHAHADNALCDPYVAALQQKGVSAYYDRADPQLGRSLGAALEEELEWTEALIVMVTPAALDSFWVNEEVDMFYVYMSQDPSRLLIPIKLAPCELPARFASRWWLDATQLSQAEVIEQILHTLKEIPLVPPPPPN